METIRTKIIAYSKTDFNKVVTRSETLEKINDSVYTYLYEKHGTCDDSDLIGVVFKIREVYYHEGTYSRSTLKRQDVAGIGAAYIANFRKNIEQRMKDGGFITSLIIEVYRQLGWDTAPLEKYRAERKARIEKEKADKEAAKKMADEAAAKERAAWKAERLEAARCDFLAGEFVSKETFVALCQMAGISIPIQTHGTLNRSVTEVSHNQGIRFYRQRGKAKPSLNGCFKLAQKCKEKLTAQTS